MTRTLKGISQKIFEKSQKVIFVDVENNEDKSEETIKNQIIDGIKGENIPIEIYDSGINRKYFWDKKWIIISCASFDLCISFINFKEVVRRMKISMNLN